MPHCLPAARQRTQKGVSNWKRRDNLPASPPPLTQPATPFVPQWSRVAAAADADAVAVASASCTVHCSARRFYARAATVCYSSCIGLLLGAHKVQAAAAFVVRLAPIDSPSPCSSGRSRISGVDDYNTGRTKNTRSNRTRLRVPPARAPIVRHCVEAAAAAVALAAPVCVYICGQCLRRWGGSTSTMTRSRAMRARASRGVFNYIFHFTRYAGQIIRCESHAQISDNTLQKYNRASKSTGPPESWCLEITAGFCPAHFFGMRVCATWTRKLNPSVK